MTPIQVAKAECANCDSAGNCAGIGIADDLSCYMFRQPGKCYLAAQPVKRCIYFEECVAPLAQARSREANTQERKHAAQRLTEGVRAYEMAVMSVPTAKYGKCKGCQRDVIAPKRLCGQCAKNRILKSKRQYWSKTRKNGAVEVLSGNDL
jgi:hypothetical protein